MGPAVTASLLLIEDDAPLAELICTYLTSEGFDIAHVSTAEDGLAVLNKRQFDLILCDVMLPGQSGFEIFPQLSQVSTCPLIFMTALDTSDDQVHGLDIGACDYIVKPVIPSVLLARIRNLLRRQHNQSTPQIWQQQKLTLNRSQQLLSFEEEHFQLTTQETTLLWIFVHEINQVLSREYLFEQFVGRDYDGLDRAIDLKISRLRKKLDNLNIPGLSIKTVHGRGYLLTYSPQGD